ncbi:MAG: hypothetical protein R3270_07465 [Gammaproteobacteria bacterium]|nr:hypothetical protein [Gammaproteobacteria bacterium]
MKEVQLPRPLVVKLLTMAQAANGISRGVIGARNGEPDRVVETSARGENLFDFPQAELHAAIGDLSADGRLLYAVFESRASAVTPEREDLERLKMPGLLYLVVSLGTKGVLEMQGWKLDGEQPVAIQVGIREID